MLWACHTGSEARALGQKFQLGGCFVLNCGPFILYLLAQLWTFQQHSDF